MLPKFKIVATKQLHNFLWAQKLKNLKSEIIQILQSHSPQYGDVQVFFHGSILSVIYLNHISHDVEMCTLFFHGFTEI